MGSMLEQSDRIVTVQQLAAVNSGWLIGSDEEVHFSDLKVSFCAAMMPLKSLLNFLEIPNYARTQRSQTPD
jgi:hypothetical protein